MLETDNFRASLWMVAAMALFALEDLFLKQLARDWPTGQILVCFGIAGTLMWGGLARRAGARVFDRAFLQRAVVLRNLAEAAGTMAWITALAMLPLATVSAILQSAPLMVTMGAALFLGERVGWRRWSAIALGMLGVLMILRPGAGGLSPMALLAVFSILCLTARDLSTRQVPASVTTFQLTTWAYAGTIPAGLALLALERAAPVAPTAPALAGLAAAFLAGAAGYYGVTHAMRIGEASVVAPYRYTRMVFALALSVLVLGERPDGWVLAGAALIVATGLYTFARSRWAARPPRGASPEGEVRL